GADAGGYDGEVVAQFGAHRGGLVGGGDDALASVVKGQGGEAKDFFAHRSLEPDFLHFILVEAGENGNAEYQQSWVDDAGRVHGGVEHFAAACGVNRQHTDAEPGGLVHGRRHRAGNVVILQVEEDVASRGDEIAHQ